MLDVTALGATTAACNNLANVYATCLDHFSLTSAETGAYSAVGNTSSSPYSPYIAGAGGRSTQLTVTNGITVGFGDYANYASFSQYGGSVKADTAVNGNYTLNGGTIKDAAGNGSAPELLIHDGDVYRTVKLDWHGGLRYPRLQKVGTAPGTLDALLAPR